MASEWYTARWKDNEKIMPSVTALEFRDSGQRSMLTIHEKGPGLYEAYYSTFYPNRYTWTQGIIAESFEEAQEKALHGLKKEMAGIIRAWHGLFLQVKEADSTDGADPSMDMSASCPRTSPAGPDTK